MKTETAGNISALTETTGAKITAQPGKGSLLTPGTYYFPVGDDSAWLKSIQIYWDNAFAGTFTIESCNFESSNTDANLVLDYEASTLARWIEENPPSTYIGVDATNISAAKVVWTAATGVVTAGAVGGSMVHFVFAGARRLRLKVACTTGGYVRVAATGKD